MPGAGIPPAWAPPPGVQNQWGSPVPNGTYGWAAQRRGIIPMHPLSIGEIYDGSIRAIRAHPRTMVGFPAIVIAIITLITTGPQAAVVNTVLSSPLTGGEPDTANLHQVADLAGAGGLGALIAAVHYVLATTIVSGLLILAVDGAVRGRAPAPGQLWARARPRLLSIIGLGLVVLFSAPLVLLVGLLPGLAVVFVPGLSVVGFVLLGLGGLAAALSYIAFYLAFWSVAAPALLLENLGVFAALRRSYRLVRGTFWRVFGIMLLGTIIADVIQSALGVPFSVIGSLVISIGGLDGYSGALIQLLIADIGTILAGAVVYPFTAGVSALLYFDLRMRREGLDLQATWR